MLFYKAKLEEEMFVDQMICNEKNADRCSGGLTADELEFKNVSVEEFKQEVEKQYDFIMSKIEEDKKRLELFKGSMNRDIYGLFTRVTRLYAYIKTIPLVEFSDTFDLCDLKELGKKIQNIKLDKNVIYGNEFILDINGWCEADSMEYDGGAFAIPTIRIDGPNEFEIKKYAIELAIYNKISPIFDDYVSDICGLYKMLVEEELTMKGFIKRIDPRNRQSC